MITHEANAISAEQTGPSLPVSAEDFRWMREALAVAQAAADCGEVPVSAILVTKGIRVASAHNLKELSHDPTAHAEILAIRHATTKQGDWRLENTTLYTTLEPCLMCVGAIVQARISRIVYGACDPKFGAVESIVRAFDLPWNHRPEVVGGVMPVESARILKDFFRSRRD